MQTVSKPLKKKKLSQVTTATFANAKSKKPVSKTAVKKVLKAFRPKIRSRHPTHNDLRKSLPLLPFRSVVRLGSTTNTIHDDVTHGGARIECNTVKAIATSASKLLMKEAFAKGNVKTAEWWKAVDYDKLVEKPFPVVAKSHYGSRGKGNTLIKDQNEYNTWKSGKTLGNYIVEKFYDFNREYRLHITESGCIYTNRKVLKNETPDEKRWFRNDSNSNWLLETNSSFDRPTNWKEIESACVAALKSVGLDFGACDVKVQSAKDKKGNLRKNPEFIVIEINSAPSFGEGTLQVYLKEIPKILSTKKAKMH